MWVYSCFDGDDDFATIGEVLLVEVEAGDCGQVLRKKIENLDIETKPPKSGGNEKGERNEDRQARFHGARNPSKMYRLPSRRSLPSSSRCEVHRI